MLPEKIVIAGTRRQYESYLRETGEDRRKSVYVCEHYQLLGLQNVSVVYYGHWWLNPVCGSNRLRILESENRLTRVKNHDTM